MLTIKLNSLDKEALLKVAAIASIPVYFSDPEGDLLIVTIDLEESGAAWYLARMLENQIAIDECKAIQKK